MAWNPSPAIGNANWFGNSGLATQNQLLSTSAGILNEFNTVNYSTIQVSTLSVPLWISTSVLYVSDIKGAQIDISGITINSNGLLNAPIVSLSTMNLTGVNLGGVKVGFDLGLGQAVGGLLGGLGALVGGATIAVGTGAGLAISGAAQGIGTAIAGRPDNYINSNVYETINFTSQLQVSTLGDAFPAYSSIFRTVSSISANSVPGPEMFVSSIFYPGQICIRSASDPINLITGNSNLNTSTIQSFGQWVPLVGLEPTNIQADSISTLRLKVQNEMFSPFATIQTLSNIVSFHSNVIVGQTNNPGTVFLYNLSPVEWELGFNKYAGILGGYNQLNVQTDGDIVFTQVGDPATIPQNARLQLGLNANESILTISSINAFGNILANSASISSLTVYDLTVISSFSTSYTQSNVTNISTSIINATDIYAVNGYFSSLGISTIQPFQIVGILGNSNGPYDITRTDNFFSTSYVAISSLTQNILQYSLNASVQDEPTLNIGDSPTGAWFKVTPQNITQWASTILEFTGSQGPGLIDLGWRGQWAVTPGEETNPLKAIALSGATFDIIASNAPGAFLNSLAVQESSNNAYPFGVSTLVQTPQFPAQGTAYYYRFTLPPASGGSNNGWWNYQVGFTPYNTSNNNTFSISQDINDTYITASDRLHLVAGDIKLDGLVEFDNFNVENLQANYINVNFGDIGSLSTNYAAISTIYTDQVYVNSRNGGIDASFYKSTSFQVAPTVVFPWNATFQTTSPDYLPEYQLVSPVYGINYFTSFNFSQWNNSIWINTVPASLGPPKVVLGDLNTTLGPYSGSFWINNQIAQAIPIIAIFTTGQSNIGLCAGNSIMKITTTDSGASWVLTSNVPNPQGNTANINNNSLNVTQYQSYTQIVDTQNLAIQAPNTSITTGNFNLFADQIRVQSHRYGPLPATGLPSYPIGIEFGMYQDPNMVFTYNGDFYWQSDATNVLYNVTGQIFYDINAWNIMVIPNRFRTDTYALYEFDVEPYVFNVSGGGFCWGYSRYILVNGAGDGPDGASSYVGYIVIPKNYCTYTF